jgi:hypothetical protein
MREDQYWLSACWDAERNAREMWTEEAIDAPNLPRRLARRLSLAAVRAALRAALRRTAARTAL